VGGSSSTTASSTPDSTYVNHAHLEGGRVSVDHPGQVLQLEFDTGGSHRGPDIDCGPLLT
jgi:hypothetical protein